MLVIVSDLHLQHTAHDVVRFRAADGSIREAGVRRNVDASALNLLFSEIATNVERCGARRVELIFAGDIFELHRTPRWFFGGTKLRPFARDAEQNEELRQLVHRIVDDIERENGPFFDALRRFVGDGAFVVRGAADRLAAGTEVVVHYLPGNHDRLVNTWGSLRERVRRLLSMSPSDAPFPHAVDRPRRAGYGVRVRHGHEYDVTNFAGEHREALAGNDAAYARPTLGDYVTVDIATRIAVAFRVRYAKELRDAGPAGERFRSIYSALTEFDDVRPPVLLVRYLSDALGVGEPRAVSTSEVGAPAAGDAAASAMPAPSAPPAPAPGPPVAGAHDTHGAGTFALLRPVLRDAFEAARADPFFIEEAKRRRIERYFEWPIGTAIDAAIKNFSGSTLTRLVEAFERFSRSSDPGPAAFACDEPGLAEGEIEVVVAGHTHEPGQVAIPGAKRPRARRAPAFYLDSGTWRTRIDAGEDSMFGRLRSYTMIFCYGDDEMRASSGRRFETWTGHLAAAEYGPYERGPIATLGATPQDVRFVRVIVEKIDEGETRDGAELRLFFGVDGQTLALAKDGVHDGDVIDLDDAFTVRADPALDGEVHVWGYEEDLGDNILDRDDPLPWGVDFLAREVVAPSIPEAGGPAGAHGRPFVAGRGLLALSDRSGNRLRVEYEMRRPRS